MAAGKPGAGQRKQKAYAERHPDRIKASQRKYYTKPEVLARQRGAPDRLAYCRKRGEISRSNLNDEYVRRVMAQHLNIKGSELPQSLVNAHRVHQMREVHNTVRLMP